MPVTVKYREVTDLKMDCRAVKNDYLTIEFHPDGADDEIASMFVHELGKRNEITFNRDDARRLAEALLTWADESK